MVKNTTPDLYDKEYEAIIESRFGIDCNACINCKEMFAVNSKPKINFCIIQKENENENVECINRYGVMYRSGLPGQSKMILEFLIDRLKYTDIKVFDESLKIELKKAIGKVFKRYRRGVNNEEEKNSNGNTAKYFY